MTDCIFCKVIKGELPGHFVYKDEEIVAFYDIAPKAPIHVLLAPVKHLESLKEVKTEDRKLLGEMMLMVKAIAEKLGIAETGFKVVINNGKDAGQLVYHLHIHILGGWRKGAHWVV